MCYPFPSFIPPWVLPGDSLFPFAVDDIIIMSCHFLPRLHPFLMTHPIRGFPTLTHLYACILTIRRGIPNFILHPSFREETSYAQSTLSTGNTSYALTHMFKVSASLLGMPHQPYSYFNIPFTYLACVHMTKV